MGFDGCGVYDKVDLWFSLKLNAGWETSSSFSKTSEQIHMVDDITQSLSTK